MESHGNQTMSTNGNVKDSSAYVNPQGPGITAPNGLAGLNMSLDMSTSVLNSSTQHVQSNGAELPFYNLDVQELWDWMGDPDHYSYRESY